MHSHRMCLIGWKVGNNQLFWIYPQNRLFFVCVATSARLLDWVGNAISIDERQPVTEQVLYSAAVVDVFSSIDSVFLFSIQLKFLYFKINFIIYRLINIWRN